ncbi:MAG: phospho-N-acetylmuramoyl-pentapeptide-transferase [Clostridiales bacterium]|jgi:phospho-N-acetylmuramoyl-pentapeptide-transferase|nr:phospho-N-acetylmuramoyl-pentapeptide-transferase [Clostridiales bacterium]
MKLIDLLNHPAVFFVLALLSALFAGNVMLKRARFGQAIREDGPQAHLKKSGTPTMGGVIFIVGFLIPIMLSLAFEIYSVSVAIAAVLIFGFIGFMDDYLKVVRHHNLGLRAYQKILLQLIGAIVLTVMSAQLGTGFYIPFIGRVVDFGWFFYPVTIFVILALDNAVNLTDGLDGLCASVTLVISVFFAITGLVVGNMGVMLTSVAMMGALIGYLKFNWYPAKVFMGDTGSLALGGYVVAMFILLKIQLLVPIVGIIYFAEALSVIIQVGVFKRTGKRFFKMAPLHHHFELSGWKETKIVWLFSAITLVSSIVGLYLIF